MTLLFCLCFSVCIFAGASEAEIATVAWRDLSDQDLSPEGKLALSFDKERWRHAETEHFIYHFMDAKQAKTVVVHSEVYYGWVKQLFEIAEDSWKRKAHIYVFQDKALWQEFLKKAHPRLQGDAYTNGWELYLFREPYWLSAMKTTAHEITHVILFRFLDGPIPLALNEGLAEFVSYRALAMQLGRSEYDIRTLQLVPREKFVPLKDLLSAFDYPQSQEETELFYRESELLVRYLALHHPGKNFYPFLKSISSGQPVIQSFESVYGADFETLSSRFESFATTGKA